MISLVSRKFLAMRNFKLYSGCVLSTFRSVKQSLYRNMTGKVEKIITRPIVPLEVERIILDKDQSGINDKIHNDEIEHSTFHTVQNDKIHDHKIDLDEIELSRSEQWERLNELLLLITTILMFNVTSLLIAVFQITSTNDGTVFNKALILQSQKTIGMSIF